MTPRPRLYPWVQALRAIAALSVAFVHAANDAQTNNLDPGGWIAAAAHLMPWAAGVDIFFVISGFVIVHASANLFAQPGAPSRFLHRRLTRIVPLYWALTTLFLATELVQSPAIHAEMGGPLYILASYLFIPWPRPNSLMEPALGLGWTLNYEMFFYLVLTPFLRLPRGWSVAFSAMGFYLLVVIGQTIGLPSPQLTFWANPIILEFVFGMGIALAVARGLILPAWLRLVLIAASIAILHAQIPAWRPLAYGLPAVLLVISAVSARRPERIGPPMRALLRLGDASYALYLFHPFVMRAFTLLAARIDVRTETAGIIYIVLTLLVAQLGALVINTRFERRLTKLLRNRA